VILSWNQRSSNTSERSGENAKSKNYAHFPYVLCGLAINDLEPVRITHSGATNPAYLNSVSTYDFLTQLLNENVKTQFRSAGVTSRYQMLLSTMRSSLLTSSAMEKQVAGEQDMNLWNSFESIFITAHSLTRESMPSTRKLEPFRLHRPLKTSVLSYAQTIVAQQKLVRELTPELEHCPPHQLGAELREQLV
jgi:hypothetical protein